MVCLPVKLGILYTFLTSTNDYAQLNLIPNYNSYIQKHFRNSDTIVYLDLDQEIAEKIRNAENKPTNQRRQNTRFSFNPVKRGSQVPKIATEKKRQTNTKEGEGLPKKDERKRKISDTESHKKVKTIQNQEYDNLKRENQKLLKYVFQLVKTNDQISSALEIK